MKDVRSGTLLSVWRNVSTHKPRVWKDAGGHLCLPLTLMGQLANGLAWRSDGHWERLVMRAQPSQELPWTWKVSGGKEVKTAIKLQERGGETGRRTWKLSKIDCTGIGLYLEKMLQCQIFWKIYFYCLMRVCTNPWKMSSK